MKRQRGGSAGDSVDAGAAAAEGGSGFAISLGAGGGGGGGGQTSDGPPEHLSPGYGAGYDAGFQAGLLAASQGRKLPPVPPPAPAAAEGGAGESEGSQPLRPPPRPPFIALLEDFPDLFQKEVLERLDPVDRGLLGRTGSAVRTVVKRWGLPRVGGSAEEPRVGIVAFRHSLSTFIWAVANSCPWQHATTCQILAGGGNLEVLRWAREHGCGWDECVCVRRCARAPGGVEVGAGAPLPVEYMDVYIRR